MPKQNQESKQAAEARGEKNGRERAKRQVAGMYVEPSRIVREKKAAIATWQPAAAATVELAGRCRWCGQSLAGVQRAVRTERSETLPDSALTAVAK